MVDLPLHYLQVLLLRAVSLQLVCVQYCVDVVLSRFESAKVTLQPCTAPAEGCVGLVFQSQSQSQSYFVNVYDNSTNITSVAVLQVQQDER